ncbi:hypothetical protein VNO77_35126 [Canavalia gladiata]|uniref:Uncharacterized protein n=1 Tax=Canavalia gladiata TaxID=3824 RepID=A0AAN9KG64_CANGL
MWDFCAHLMFTYYAGFLRCIAVIPKEDLDPFPLSSSMPRSKAFDIIFFISSLLVELLALSPKSSTSILPPEGKIQFYRYEVYTPSGIWVDVTLGDQ